MTEEAYPKFQKIARLRRECIITEKIDGTNALIWIGENGEFRTGSRTRWITPEKGCDNAGFSVWAHEHKEELLQLGPGHHYGEWWGQGIQRGYDLTEKRFSLFNVGRWENAVLPECVSLVPVLYRGPFETYECNIELDLLIVYGSKAAPGFMDPEGIVVFHTASGMLFKQTIKNDEKPKGNKE
jgi:hypothetical protein